MENANLLVLFVALTAVAVVIQAGMMIGIYLGMRKSVAQMEALAGEMRTKFLPAAETAQSMLTTLRPALENVINNASETSTIVHAQLQRLDATLTDILDRARLQVIRADEMLSHTLDRVENTTEMVHKTVVSPIRQLSGLVQGVTAGLEFLVGGKRSRDGAPTPHDEMFI